MDRLKSEAVKAVDDIQALFADGPHAGHRSLRQRRPCPGALQALSAIEIPEGLEATVTDGIKAVQTDAARARLIEQLPADPAKAANMIASIKDALLGKPASPAALQPKRRSRSHRASMCCVSSRMAPRLLLAMPFPAPRSKSSMVQRSFPHEPSMVPAILLLDQPLPPR